MLSYIIFICCDVCFNIIFIGHVTSSDLDAATKICRCLNFLCGLFQDFCAAISVGVVGALPSLDLDYSEDSTAEVDMNVVKTGGGRFIEVQGTAEGAPFSGAELSDMLALAESGIQLMKLSSPM